MSRTRNFLVECGSATPSEPYNSHDELLGLDHDIAQLTRLKSEPHKYMSRRLPGKSMLPISPVEMLARREANFSGRGRFSSADGCHVLNRYLPVNGPSLIDTMDSSGYVSQFSGDGSLFVAGFQESHIRIYNVDSGWKVQKDIRARSLRWTITDASLSPDQRFLVYSSMSPIVHIVNIGSAATESVANITEIHEGLDFSAGYDFEDDDYYYDAFGIFSVKFSNDGRELVAASSDASIYIYDLGANKLSMRFPAHMCDVNTVCFADESGHIIYSGSDDGLCKVLDRRCLINNEQASGVLVGHLEGVTFIDSRGDGRYLISNGKDQTIKLWDIRKMSSNLSHFLCSNPYKRNVRWDYRWMEYPVRLRNSRHPNDISLATYKGHSVLRTLIRCYFSPAYSTGQKYIYTGSADDSVYIYDLLTGAQVAKLDYHEGPVRDCSWHPNYPTLVSSSWDGTVAKWDFSDKSLNQSSETETV
ncbi:LEC14B homolog isoform X1 [Daucus carota subsp. sativus]|uniref:LEC14B homolog isoform X1 n=1 Tax=Daucus carota subsp. sativus TaxID=79200 RepID=UPI0007EFC545|nr:PREDICTED: LEC14B homolog isoform X1 [Daucus carota subsp. sativus]XP_017223658.1 PREDICTED: LEC14B homolog isoform X1 [Daucus carota subsp. sativus]